jgi:hypothetical protein
MPPRHGAPSGCTWRGDGLQIRRVAKNISNGNCGRPKMGDLYIWRFLQGEKKGSYEIYHTFQLFVEAVLHIISFIFCWSMNVQNNDMAPTTS